MEFSVASFFPALPLLCVLAQASIPYNPADYLEVYPDPTDPEVLRGRTPLHFALIQSLGGALSQFDAPGSVAGVKVALDLINNDSNLLPGYTLHYTFVESECNRTKSLSSLFYQILREPRKLAVLGSGCSVATEPAAEVSHFYNISQLSCLASSPELRDRTRFLNYFQLLPTEDTTFFAYYGVIKEFGWRRVELLVQDENIFTVAIEFLTDLLDRDEIDYNTNMFDTDRGITDLGPEPFDMSSRIFILAMYEVNARALLCEAYSKDIHLPRYLLLTPGWYEESWWSVDDEGLNCTAEQRESVVASTLGSLNTGFLGSIPDDNSIGITGEEFVTLQQEYLGVPPFNLNVSEFAPHCHDATWTLAYALNETLTSISDPTLNADLAEAYNVTPPFRLEDFAYDSRGLLDVILEHLGNTNFTGLSGPVVYGDEGIRDVDHVVIFQYRNQTNDGGQVSLQRVRIGTVWLTEGDNYDFVYSDGEDMQSVWQGLVPYDGVPDKVIVSIHPALTAVFIVLASVGITFAVACLIFNFICRKSKLIKLSSPKLNYIIGIGAIILYLAGIVAVIPSTDPDAVAVFCNLTPWLAAIGYSLCYGTIVVKMARVYRIFTNPSTNKKGIQDWKLLLGVTCLVAFDLVILIVFTVVEGLRGNLGPGLEESQENLQDVDGELGVITEYCFYLCHSTNRDIFLGFLYGYKLLLQAFALLVAFSIRKVKVKGLNDAKYVGAAIYVTSIVLVAVIVATHSLRDYVNGSAALFAAGFQIGTTVILCLVFVPLMKGLYKDPKGENIFSKKATSSDTMGNLAGKSSDTFTLKSRIKELEEELAAIKQKCPTETSKTATMETTFCALENSNMVTADLVSERSGNGTIWDSAVEEPDVNEKLEEDKRMGNGNETLGNEKAIAENRVVI